MLSKRSDPKIGMILTAIWFAEPGPYNRSLTQGNPYLVIRSGESLLLHIAWEVPNDLDLGDMAVEYLDVHGFCSYFARLDRVRSN
jgi:hypothetical protein